MDKCKHENMAGNPSYSDVCDDCGESETDIMKQAVEEIRESAEKLRDTLREGVENLPEHRDAPWVEHLQSIVDHITDTLKKARGK